MSRTGLGVALAVAAVAGLVLGLFPQIDLDVAGLFASGGTFPLISNPVLKVLREVSSGLIALLAAPAFIALFLKLVRPRRPLLMRGRAVVLIISTLALGPLLTTNVILKEHFGRARPIDVIELGGADPFTAWWDPRGRCPANCSFVAGEASGAFWTVAPAALAPLPWRPLAYAGAVTFGSVVGLMRMSFGGHFLSDVIFAGVITFVIVWLVHGALYRWAGGRFTDAAIEQAIERLALALRRPFGGGTPPGGLARQRAPEPDPRPR
jgi:membrane-associated PAP2 superfamily phosphatase